MRGANTASTTCIYLGSLTAALDLARSSFGGAGFFKFKATGSSFLAAGFVDFSFLGSSLGSTLGFLASLGSLTNFGSAFFFSDS